MVDYVVEVIRQDDCITRKVSEFEFRMYIKGVLDAGGEVRVTDVIFKSNDKDDEERF